MAALILPSRRVVQPQGPVEIDGGSPLGKSLGFSVSDFTGRDVVGQRLVTRSASLAYGTTALGRGFSSAANAAFSAPLDLSGTSEITVAFILKRNTATGTQVLVEHTINQNNQAGSFLIYTDTTNFLASISNGIGGAASFNVASCAAPAVGRTTKVVVTLARRGTSAQACRIWYDGVEQVTSQPNTGSISGNFANSTTYFFGRAAASLFANGVIHDAAIWLRSLADAEVAQWSANPWQLFRPIQRRIWVPVAGGAATLTVADASHAHSAENAALSIDVALTVQNAEHAHTAESVVVGAVETLTVANAAHAHSAENVTLTVGGIGLTVADATHAQAAESVALSADSFLITANGSHGQAADLVTLSTATFFSVDSAAHAQTADNLSLDGAPTLAVNAAQHAQAADGVALGMDSWLAVANTAHAQTADQPTLTVTGDDVPETYPLAGFSQDFPLAGQAQTYPLQG